MTLFFSSLSKNIFSFKLKIISSLFIVGCIDQFNFLHFLSIQPHFSFLTVYFWSFFFNHYLSFLMIFLFGMFVDLIGGSFLGVNTLVFTLLYGSISFYQEHYSKDVSLEWKVFWISMGFLTFLQILLFSLIHERLVLSWVHLFENGLTILFYPCIKYSLKWLIKERKAV